jgi:uncharacterized membrane protein YeaQ/YmgE (transglycosylase-associated protein family)
VSELELSPVAQHWTNVVLIWLGFGIVAGLLAKLLVPGREPAGPLGTLMIGILGSVLGPLVLTLVLHRQDFNPISPVGLLTSVGGALLFLAAYRCLVAFVGARRLDDID